MSFLSEPTIFTIVLVAGAAVYGYVMIRASAKQKPPNSFLPPPPIDCSPGEQPLPNSIYRRMLGLPPPLPIEKKLKEAKASQRKQAEHVKELEAKVGALDWAIKLKPDSPAQKTKNNHVSKKEDDKTIPSLEEENKQ